jgi:hypothetical protein
MRRRIVLALAVVIALPASLVAEIKDGHWRFSQMVNATANVPVFLLKVEKKDGKLTAEVADLPVKSPAKLDGFTADGDKVTFTVDLGSTKLTFDGTVDPKDDKVIRGSYGDDRRIVRGILVVQEAGKLPNRAELMAGAPKAPEPYAAAQKLNVAPLQFQFRAQQSKDANEKGELLAKAKEARQEADEKVPGLYRETVDKQPDSPYAIDAAVQLLRAAGKTKADAADVGKWVKLIDQDAARYGPRFARETALTTAEVLNVQKGYEAIALAAATKGSKGVTEKSPLLAQSRALRALKVAQTAAGNGEEAKATEARLVRVETALDDEYLRSVPPFKPEKFAGRKDNAANRVVVMEMFTGAQCPPCVAADAAFDGLEKTYDAKDLILIQYHMHIPGPDPMTNPDTIARWDYYRAKFEEEIGGVPSTLFNGKPQAGGGGGMPAAERKYKQYRDIIDGLAEEKTDVVVTGSARRAGDKLTVDVGVDGVKGADNKVRLRLVVVEETVRYAGSNGMRFHHRVVRAMPGGHEGIEVKDAPLKRTVGADLAEIRKGLTKYLDEYAADRPFPNPDRPMDLAHLKVIALVQNDDTGEILNATELAVTGK